MSSTATGISDDSKDLNVEDSGSELGFMRGHKPQTVTVATAET